MWNMNGNWLASGSTDSLIKIFDIRMMKEVEVWRGQNSEVCRLQWHPIHETLLVSGGYNGALVYWIFGEHQVSFIAKVFDFFPHFQFEKSTLDTSFYYW
jgi:polyadenylation factor subunit 2